MPGTARSSRAGNPDEAIRYWSIAEELAARRSSVREAVSHFRKALSVLPQLEHGTQRNRTELALNMALAVALIHMEGYRFPETLQHFSRAHELASSLGLHDAYVAAAAGAGNCLFALGKLEPVIEVFERLSRAETARLAPMSRAFRSGSLGVAMFLSGRLAAAGRHLRDTQRTLEAMHPDALQFWGGGNPIVTTRVYLSRLYLLQGHLSRTDERFYAAELLRLRSRWHELGDDTVLAERNYRQAIEIAERQGARLFSLRSAAGLARLLQIQGRREDARKSLRPILGFFPKDSGHAPVIRASALLRFEEAQPGELAAHLDHFLHDAAARPKAGTPRK